MHYVALIDGAVGAYGVVFPDLDGCTAMGGTVDEALVNAGEALRDWVEATEAQGRNVPSPRKAEAIRGDQDVQEALGEGAMLSSVLLVRDLGRPVKANLSLDSGILASIDAAAGRLGITRSALVERLARERLPEYA